MEGFSDRLRKRAEELGISNAEAARRAGLDERRYAHYISGRSETDLTTLVKIAEALGTAPNWLLGVEELSDRDPEKAALVQRFAHAAELMPNRDVETCVIQAEAVAKRG
ncbi:MAG: helix-turn-helix domain-containing protein [Desulfobulbia bacterium]